PATTLHAAPPPANNAPNTMKVAAPPQMSPAHATVQSAKNPLSGTWQEASTAAVIAPTIWSLAGSGPSDIWAAIDVNGIVGSMHYDGTSWKGPLQNEKGGPVGVQSVTAVVAN